MLYVIRAVAVLAVFFVVAPLARAQTVVVVWGDSIACGYNSHLRPPGTTPTPFAAQAFARPAARVVPGAFRWDWPTSSWAPLDDRGNWQRRGCDPAFGFATAFRRSRPEPLYVIAAGVPGSDATPTHPNALATWAPSSSVGLFPHLRDGIVQAQATLQAPQLHSILFSAGNTQPTPALVDDVDAVNVAVEALFQGPPPLHLGCRSYALTHPDTTMNRALMPVWANGSPRRRLVDLSHLPHTTGGLPDGVHLSQSGAVGVGMEAWWAAQ